jgi:hypothetical protein
MTNYIEINYDAQTKDYACYINGELIGFAKTYDAAEAKINATVLERIYATRPYRIAQLANDYSKARAEGRTDDAKAIKAEATQLIAERDGIEYSVFASEHAAYVAERAA